MKTKGKKYTSPSMKVFTLQVRRPLLLLVNSTEEKEVIGGEGEED